MLEDGYHFHLIFLWLPSVEMAVERVKDRVRRGGHHIPEPTIRRRYEAGLRNFYGLYAPMARWQIYDNTASLPRLIATGTQTRITDIEDDIRWDYLIRTHGGLGRGE